MMGGTIGWDAERAREGGRESDREGAQICLEMAKKNVWVLCGRGEIRRGWDE